MPTYSTVNWRNSSFYYLYKSISKELSSQPNTFTFSSVGFKGITKEGACPAWKAFYKTTVVPPADDIAFVGITVASVKYDTVLDYLVVNSSMSCGRSTALPKFLYDVSIGKNAAIYCNNQVLKVFTCPGVGAIACVNCSAACWDPSTCPSLTDGIVISPCQRPNKLCKSTNNFMSFVQLDYTHLILYPQILEAITATTGLRELELRVNVSTAGTAYCAAFGAGRVLSSALEVKSAAVPFGISGAGVFFVPISNLIPSTSYDIYCYTEDFKGHGMSLINVQATRKSVVTSCCRAISLTTTFKGIPEASAGGASSYVFQFRLEALPPQDMQVSVQLQSLPNCAWSIDAASAVATAVPQSFLFSSSKPNLVGNFIVKGAPGCYNLIVLKNGNQTYSNATAALIVRGSNVPPPQPNLKSAFFSNDGLSVVVNFDAMTDQAAKVVQKYSGAFPCALILTIQGSPNSLCRWSSAVQMVATLVASVNVGSSVGLVPYRVKPLCAAALSCGASNSSITLTVGAALNPPLPQVSLSSSLTISKCDSIVIDPTLSKGNMGRGWASVLWTVASTVASSSRLAAISDLLNKQFNSTNDLATIPNKLLLPATYTISLTLDNFALKSSVGFITVQMTDSTDTPKFSITGPQVLSQLRWQPTSIFASASMPNCGGGEAAPKFTYTWKAYQGLTYLSAVTSNSLDARFFKLPAFTLDALNTYTSE